MFRKSNYGSIRGPEIGNRSDAISTEFDSLSYDIATNVFAINSSIKNLQDAIKATGTSTDNEGFRKKIHISQLSANQVALVTTQDVNKLKAYLPKDAKQEELVDKLEGKFMEAVTKYASLQKELAEKQKPQVLPSAAIVESASSDDGVSKGQENQEQLSTDLQFKLEMQLEREPKVTQIEEDVLDVNQIMADLESCVHAHQGDTTGLIVKDVNVRHAHTEDEKLLGEASNDQNKSRRKLLILLIIALIVSSVLITILVTTLKK